MLVLRRSHHWWWIAVQNKLNQPPTCIKHQNELLLRLLLLLLMCISNYIFNLFIYFVTATQCYNNNTTTVNSFKETCVQSGEKGQCNEGYQRWPAAAAGGRWVQCQCAHTAIMDAKGKGMLLLLQAVDCMLCCMQCMSINLLNMPLACIAWVVCCQLSLNNLLVQLNDSSNSNSNRNRSRSQSMPPPPSPSTPAAAATTTSTTPSPAAAATTTTTPTSTPAAASTTTPPTPTWTRGGKRQVYTKELKQEVSYSLGLGMPLTDASQQYGVNLGTCSAWLSKELRRKKQVLLLLFTWALTISLHVLLFACVWMNGMHLISVACACNLVFVNVMLLLCYRNRKHMSCASSSNSNQLQQHNHHHLLLLLLAQLNVHVVVAMWLLLMLDCVVMIICYFCNVLVFACFRQMQAHQQLQHNH